MPVVLMVRHGQASFGSEDYDVLSDVGREQSRVVGAELARRALRSPVAVCGSLLRQRDTAEIALSVAGLDAAPSTDPRWDEYDHLDLLRRYVAEDAAHDGTSRGVQVLLDRALSAWVSDPAGDWEDFRGGAVAALDGLVGTLAGQDAVVFTSGGVIAAVCSTLLGVGSSGVVGLNRVTVNGAITKLVVGSGGTSLLAFNDHAHFEGDRRELVTYR